jgi:hypothetical protein
MNPRYRNFLIVTLFVAIVSFEVVGAEEKRWEAYLSIEEVSGVEAAEILSEAVVTALVREVDARWRYNTDELVIQPPPWPPALIVTLNVLPHDETSVRVVVEGTISVTDETVVAWEQVIRPDRAGRFLDPGFWHELVMHVQEGVRLLAHVSPTTLTLTGMPGATVSGLSESGEILDEEGRLSVLVVPFQTYDLLLQFPGYRDQHVVVTPTLEDLTLLVPQEKYPRHTITLSLHELAFPSVEYSYFDDTTTWFGSVGFTSYAGGLTPFTAYTADPEDKERGLFTSLPLLRANILGGMLFRDRDQRLRFWIQGGGFIRWHYPEGSWGLEPTLPFGGMVRLGVDYELPGPLTLTAGMTTDMFIPRAPDFVDWTFGMRRVGPMILQTGLMHIGLRVVL